MDFLDTNKKQIEEWRSLFIEKLCTTVEQIEQRENRILKFLKDKICGRKKDSFEPRCIN